MTAPHVVDPAGLLGDALAEAGPDLMRHLLQTMINAPLFRPVSAAVNVDFRPISMSSSRIMQPASPRKGL